jgi:hypothetical protein
MRGRENAAKNLQQLTNTILRPNSIHILNHAVHQVRSTHEEPEYEYDKPGNG